MATKHTRIVVVGGCGFLGHHVVSHLQSFQVFVIDLQTTKNRQDGITYFDVDITDEAAVLAAFRKIQPHAIVHTASPAGTSFAGSEALYRKVNVEGTETLLSCARKVDGIKAFVYTSSASVIHDGLTDLVMADETYPILDPPQQTEYYSFTKGVAERSVLQSNRRGGMLTAAIRPTSMFGEGDVQQLPNMLKVYYDGKTKVQLGDNSKYFDFVYVGNVAHAHVLAVKKLLETADAIDRDAKLLDAQESKIDGEVFIVTNDDPMHFWDYARAVWAAAGDKSNPRDVWVLPAWLVWSMATASEWIFWLVYGDKKRPNLTRQKVRFCFIHRTFRIDKIKSRLGYTPIWSIREGIKRGVEWFENQPSGHLEKS